MIKILIFFIILLSACGPDVNQQSFMDCQLTKHFIVQKLEKQWTKEDKLCEMMTIQCMQVCRANIINCPDVANDTIKYCKGLIN